MINTSVVHGIAVPNYSNAIWEHQHMYLDNKYTTWYYSIVNNAKKRKLTGYVEKHHIIPKSLGGLDNTANLVILSSREHYICHLLLTKMVDGNNKRKMTFALHSMLRSSKVQDRHKLNSKQYENIRNQFSIAMSEFMIETSKHRDYKLEKNPFFGKKHNDDTKKRTSGENHYTKRTDYDASTHPSKQPGWKEANSISKKGRKQPVYTCENCNKKIGAKGNYIRWHGINCRLNTKRN